jgi:hypothetical protein
MHSIIEYTKSDENGARTISAWVMKSPREVPAEACTKAVLTLRDSVKVLPGTFTPKTRYQSSESRIHLSATIVGASDADMLDLANAFAESVKSVFGVSVIVAPMKKH